VDAGFSALSIETLTAQGQSSGELLVEVTRQHRCELSSIRLHELYFETLVPGGSTQAGPLLQAVVARNFQGSPAWKHNFIEKALTRGIGWAVTMFQPESGLLLNHWISGNEPDPALANCKPVLALDMWEHAYILDYPPGERIRYTESFLQNVNWEVIEDRLRDI